MKAIAHPQVTHTLRSKRANMRDMPLYSDGITSVVVFEVTDEDLKRIAEGRKVYLTIIHPPDKLFPPLTVTTDNPIPHPILSK